MRNFIVLAAVVMVGGGCEQSTAEGGCDLCTASAVVKGVVDDSVSVIRERTRVSVKAFEAVCADTVSVNAANAEGDAMTDSVGNFRAVVTSVAYGAFTAKCIVVTVPRAGQPDRFAFPGNLVLRGDHGAAARIPRDSTFLKIVITAPL